MPTFSSRIQPLRSLSFSLSLSLSQGINACTLYNWLKNWRKRIITYSIHATCPWMLKNISYLSKVKYCVRFFLVGFSFLAFWVFLWVSFLGSRQIKSSLMSGIQNKTWLFFSVFSALHVHFRRIWQSSKCEILGRNVLNIVWSGKGISG